jgi:putative membrane protein
MITEAQQREIMAAVAAAEARTDGEVVCVFARQVSHYPEISLAAGAFAALAIPPLALALGLHPGVLLHQVLTATGALSGWSTAGLPQDAETMMILDGYAVVQAVLFTSVALLASVPPIRRLLTPGALKRHRVHKSAWAQFVATGLHTTEGVTGVLIFASLDDRVVEIVAEEAIHQKVGDKVWNAAVAAVRKGMKARDPVKGFVTAIEICGGALAEHFPSTGPRANAVSDRLVEL